MRFPSNTKSSQVDASAQARVRLFGEAGCHKSRLYEDVLTRLGVAYRFYDVVQDETAARVLRSLFPDGGLKYPTFVIEGKTIRNPAVKQLEKTLMREQIIPQEVLHEPHANRFVLYMKPRDSFVSYSKASGKMVLTHIEVPVEKRGSGLGARLAVQVFQMVQDMGEPARLQCPFLRKVASRSKEWSHYFGLAPSW